MPDDLVLDGYKELSRKLSALGQKVGGKVLRGAMMRATTKVVRDMKSKIPVGTSFHRTYKGNPVGPGFASRSIKRVTRIKDGYASLRIGVRREAFYAIQFLDLRSGRTPYKISKRRVLTGRRSVVKSHIRVSKTGKIRKVAMHETRRRGRRSQSIKPYTLTAVPWFSSVFERHQNNMTKDVGKYMGNLIEKAAKQ